MSESSPDQHRVTRGKFRLGRLLSGRATSPVRPAKHHPVKEDIDALAKRILLPSLPVSDEEMARAAHQDRGQKLARQEMWDTLSEKLRYADRSRLSTPGGETASLLLAFGARSDVVSAAEDALHDGKVPDMAGIEALEEMQADYPTEYPCALIVALAHIDIGWAWRNIAGPHDPEGAVRKCQWHLDRAEAILAPFDAEALNAPSLAAAKCALNAACHARWRKVAEGYEALIALDPDSHRHMRALGRHLLPGYAGGAKAVEIEARRTAARTQATWGAGAYAWVYFDALALSRQTLDLLDAGFFIEGLHDIIARKQDQHIVNLLAAFCAITMAPQTKGAPLPDHADTARARVHDCLDWLLEDHIQELHPLIWSQTLLAPGHAPLLPSRRALIVKGRQTALRIIATRFASQISDGSSIAFSRAGMYRLPAL